MRKSKWKVVCHGVTKSRHRKKSAAKKARGKRSGCRVVRGGAGRHHKRHHKKHKR